MGKTPILSGDEVVKTLNRFGWRVARQRGSHIILVKEGHDGTNWKDITGIMTMSYWENLSIVAQSDAIYVGNNSGAYKSTDTGTSWVKKNNLPYAKVIAGTTTGNLYALSQYSSGLIVTTDGGQSWGTVSSSSFQDMLVYQGAMYATTYNGIFKSTNNGSTWGTLTAGLPSQNISSPIVFSGHPSNSSILYAWIRTYSPAGKVGVVR